MAESIRLRFHVETRASQARTWRALSDTDAFNRLARANFSYATETTPDGSSRTVGTVKKLGLAIRFHEEPFSFRAPHWFRIRRVFEGGPARALTATAQLATLSTGGTRIDYELEVEPRSGLFRPILSFDLGRTTEKYLAHALSSLIGELDREGEVDPEWVLLGPPPALTAKQSARLDDLAAQLGPSALTARLASFVRAAPERDQLMMSPLALSQAWLTPLGDLVSHFIDATRLGLLGARIDLLCPACLVPRAQVEEGGPPPRVHCESCNVTLDAAYPESLAVHFFPNPEIRALRAKIECLGSPARTPHVVAQDTLDPGATADFTMGFEPGTYQVRTLPVIGPAALIVVGDGEQGDAAPFRLEASLQPQLVHLRPEPREVSLTNASGSRVTVVIERLVPPRKVLTLGRLLAEYPSLAELVPTRGFMSTMACFRAHALAVRAPTEDAARGLAAALRSARVAYPSGAIVLAIYADPDALFADLAAVDLSGSLTGLSVGSAFESVVGGRSIPMGPSVDEAYAALTASYPGRIATAHETLRLPDVAAAAARRQWTAHTSPYGGPKVTWLQRAPQA